MNFSSGCPRLEIRKLLQVDVLFLFDVADGIKTAARFFCRE
jgi:hypothetical protein